MCVVVKKKKEKEMQAEADRKLIFQMKNPVHVSAYLLAETGVEKAPCFCCLRGIKKTCPHAVGDTACKDYVLYSKSPEKVRMKLVGHLADIRHRAVQRIRAAA